MATRAAADARYRAKRRCEYCQRPGLTRADFDKIPTGPSYYFKLCRRCRSEGHSLIEPCNGIPVQVAVAGPQEATSGTARLRVPGCRLLVR